MKAGSTILAALALCAATTSGALAQVAPRGTTAGQPDGQDITGAGSAAGAADTPGQSATPATLLVGVFDIGNGLALSVNYTGQAAANPIGGIRQGSAGIQVTPAIRLTPNLQYIVDPDQTRFPTYRKSIPNAFVVGAKLSVDLFTLAGFAKGPGSD